MPASGIDATRAGIRLLDCGDESAVQQASAGHDEPAAGRQSGRRERTNRKDAPPPS